MQKVVTNTTLTGSYTQAAIQVTSTYRTRIPPAREGKSVVPVSPGQCVSWRSSYMLSKVYL